MDRTSLKSRTIVNTSYNMMSFLIPIIISIFVAPIIILNLGVKEYGIYIFINTVIGFLGLLDLGLGLAVTKHFAHYKGKNDFKAMERLAHTSNSIFSLIGIFILLVLIGGYLSLSYLPLPELFSGYRGYAILFVIAGMAFFMDNMARTYSAILNALQRYDILTKIGTSIFILTSLSNLVIVLLGGGIQYLFIVQLVGSTISALLVFRAARKHSQVRVFGYGWDKEEVKNSYKFGIATVINNLAGTALGYLDKIVIPFFVGPSNLGYYNVAGSVATKIPGVSNNLTTLLFPMASELSGAQDTEKLSRVYVRSLRLITIMGAALTITSIAFAHDILLQWLNAEFAEKATATLIVLAATNFIISLTGLATNFLLGLGRIRLLTKVSLMTAGVNAALLFLLLPKFGILGAAWAYLISVIPGVYLFYFIEKKYFNLPGRKSYYSRKLIGTLLTASIVFLFDFFLISPLVNSLLGLAFAGMTSMCLYVIIYKLLGFFEEEDWKDMEDLLSKILRRKKTT